MAIETEAVIGWFKLHLWMWLVDLNYNFGRDWLMEHKKLASKLKENVSFSNQPQSRKL